MQRSSDLALEEKKKIKQIYNFAKLVPHFITHVIYARKDLVANDKDTVRRFVAAWFDTIDWMGKHRAKSNEISADVLHLPKKLIARIYDLEYPEFSHTGKFDPKAVEILKESWVELGRLDHKPTDSELFTEEFLPQRHASK